MIFGYTFDKEGSPTGGQDTLRYSALNTWLSSKESYRKRYYEGLSISTPEMIFGHQIHRRIEEGEVVLPGLPRYPKAEYNIEVAIGPKNNQIKIGGCIDSFDPKTLSFLDYKSGHLSKEGKIPWSAVKVSRHMQLVFYSLLIKKKHGKVDPYTKLIWIETACKKKTVLFQGHELEAESRELSLTGRYEVFTRRIAEWERSVLVKTIKRCAVEISEDFANYKRAHG